MFAVPVAFAVTTPFTIVATEALSVFQTIFKFEAFAGSTFAVRFAVLPTKRFTDVGFTVTPVTEIVEVPDCAVTVTVLVATNPPSTVVTVIFAVPVAFDVTTPLIETVATKELSEAQLIF